MVVDTSVLLAVFFKEPNAKWAAARLQEHEGELLMSTVNLAETLIRVRDRQPRHCDEIEAALLSSSIRFVPPDVVQARIAAEARLSLPPNLGDCFAYALAKANNCPVLTLDTGFRSADCQAVAPWAR